MHLLSCKESAKDRHSQNNSLGYTLTDSQTKKVISLKLVDSVEESSKEYDLYLNTTRYSYSSPFVSADSIYTLNDYHNIKTEKFISGGGGNLMCYSYANGKAEKFFIVADKIKIYGYNVSSGGTLEFTVENPIESMDGWTKILYADTSVVFVLDDIPNRNVRLHRDMSPASVVIYKYDLTKKEKTEFFRSVSIRPFGHLHEYSSYYISKVNRGKFLFAAGTPDLDNKNTASLKALSYIFDAESKTPYGDAAITLLNDARRTLYQVPDPYNSCLFVLKASPEVLSTATNYNDYSIGMGLEYLSFSLEDFDVHLQKNPVFFFNTDSEIRQLGSLYIIIQNNGFQYITKDLVNFYLIPFTEGKIRFSHVIFLPKQNKYCYIEVNNNRTGKVYIYEILNLKNIFLNL